MESKMIVAFDEMKWPARTDLRESTYGHAEDRLLGLVNFTLGHCEGCAEDRCNNKKKERRLGSVKKNTRDGEEKREKKEEKGRKGEKIKYCLGTPYAGTSERSGLVPNQEEL